MTEKVKIKKILIAGKYVYASEQKLRQLIQYRMKKGIPLHIISLYLGISRDEVEELIAK